MSQRALEAGASPEPPPLWRAVGTVLVKLRYLVVLLWIAAAVAATMYLPTVREAQVGGLGNLIPNDAPAIKAEVQSKTLFRVPILSRTVVVLRDGNGLPAAEQAHIARTILAVDRSAQPGLEGLAGALPVVNGVPLIRRGALRRIGGLPRIPPLGAEPATAAVVYLFFRPGVNSDEQVSIAHRLVDDHLKPGFDGYAGVTGAVPARNEQTRTITDSLRWVEIATVLLVAIAVGLRFGAPGAAVITLAAIAAAYLISVRVVAYVGEQVGVVVPAEVEPVIVVLLFGILTDYSIFFLSRARRRMAEGEEPRAATARGAAELLPIILAAGLTLAVATGALAIANLDFLQAFGPGMAMSVIVGLLIAVTFIPAALAIGGRKAFWPRGLGPRIARTAAADAELAGGSSHPRRARAVRLATRHPVLIATGCLLLLLAAASGVRDIHVGDPVIRGLPGDAGPRRAYEQASRGFPPGILSPTVVVVQGPGVTRRRGALAAFEAGLRAQPGVAKVVGPAEQPHSQPLGAVLSAGGNAARLVVVFDSDPLGATAVDRLRELQHLAPALLRAAGLSGASASFAGDTALVTDTIDRASGDLIRVGALAAILVVIVLGILLRALVAPLYLVGASVLVLLASLGLTAYLFQGIFDYSGLIYFVPVAATILLASLGSDYNVFLAGRIWAEADRRELREAVAVAGARAAAPITVAGLVLAGSFALLAIVPLLPFRELAFAMAVGLLIDAFLVRTMLVPALVVLIGPRSGWPSSRLHSAPRSAGGDPGLSGVGVDSSAP